MWLYCVVVLNNWHTNWVQEIVLSRRIVLQPCGYNIHWLKYNRGKIFILYCWLMLSCHKTFILFSQKLFCIKFWYRTLSCKALHIIPLYLWVWAIMMSLFIEPWRWCFHQLWYCLWWYCWKWDINLIGNWENKLSHSLSKKFLWRETTQYTRKEAILGAIITWDSVGVIAFNRWIVEWLCGRLDFITDNYHIVLL